MDLHAKLEGPVKHSDRSMSISRDRCDLGSLAPCCCQDPEGVGADRREGSVLVSHYRYALSACDTGDAGWDMLVTND